ncbi:MAG: hypothetical protein ACOCV2_07225, partial [Persicimonas sp.]
GLNYEGVAEAHRLELGGHRAERARAALRGALTPPGEGARWPIETLAARGTLDLFRYRADRLRARRVATNIDVSDAFPLGRGDISAQLSGVRVGDQRFRSTEAKLRLYDGPDFKFESKSRVDISLLPDLPLHLDAIGRHADDLSTLSLDDLRVGRPGMRWKLQNPGLVHLEDGAVELQSIALERGSKRLPFDGVFGEQGGDSFGASLERLKDEELRSLFDILPF